MTRSPRIPRVPPEEAILRDRKLHVMLSEDELRRAHELACARGTNISGLVRRLLACAPLAVAFLLTRCGGEMAAPAECVDGVEECLAPTSLECTNHRACVGGTWKLSCCASCEAGVCQ